MSQSTVSSNVRVKVTRRFDEWLLSKFGPTHSLTLRDLNVLPVERERVTKLGAEDISPSSAAFITCKGEQVSSLYFPSEGLWDCGGIKMFSFFFFSVHRYTLVFSSGGSVGNPLGL